MRNDTSKWPMPTRGHKPNHTSGGIRLRHIIDLPQTLISGPRPSNLENAVGWPEVAMTGTYAVSLRRDRILSVGPQPKTMGWDDANGLAVSDASSNYAVIDISGPRALEVLCTGTEISLEHPSNSALRLWNGYGCILYRHGGEDNFRMHVTSAFFEAAWDMLLRQTTLISGK